MQNIIYRYSQTRVMGVVKDRTLVAGRGNSRGHLHGSWGKVSWEWVYGVVWRRIHSGTLGTLEVAWGSVGGGGGGSIVGAKHKLLDDESPM